MRTMYLHIGAHKTASSLLQSIINNNLDDLLKQNLKVFKRAQMMNMDMFKSLCSILNDCEKLESEKLSSEIKEIEEFQGDILFTNEDMFTSLGLEDFYLNIDKGIEYIKQLFPNHKVVVILYIRNQVDYIESLYTQFVHIGKGMDFRDFVKVHDIYSVNWNSVYDNIAKEIPEDDIKIIPYETISNGGVEKYYENFMTHMNVDVSDHDLGEVNGRQSNRSFSEVAIEMFNYACPKLDNAADKNKLRIFLQNNFSTATHARKIIINKRDSMILRLHYNNSNESIISKVESDVASDLVRKKYIYKNYKLSVIKRALVNLYLKMKRK